MSLNANDPVWLNEHEYEVRWKGRLVRVDIRKLQRCRISDDLIRASSVSLTTLLRRLAR